MRIAKPRPNTLGLRKWRTFYITVLIDPQTCSSTTETTGFCGKIPGTSAVLLWHLAESLHNNFKRLLMFIFHTRKLNSFDTLKKNWDIPCWWCVMLCKWLQITKRFDESYKTQRSFADMEKIAVSLGMSKHYICGFRYYKNSTGQFSYELHLC